MTKKTGYVEILITTEDFETASPAGLGMMIQNVYQEFGEAPILIRVTDDVTVGPWAADQENNFNRLDIRNGGS